MSLIAALSCPDEAPPDAVMYGAIGSEIQRINEAIVAGQKTVDDGELPAVEQPDDINEGGAGNDEDESTAKMEGNDDDMEVVEAQSRWWGFAGDLIRKFVELAPVPRSDTELRECMEGSIVYKTDIKDEKRFDLHIYNSKMDGECKTQPVLRMPVLRSNHLQRCIKASLLARTHGSTEEDVEIPEKSMFMFLDGYKHDNANVFNNGFTIGDRRLQKVRQAVYVTYDEASLKKRRQRNDTRAKMSVVEILTIVTKSDFALAARKRLLCDGSSNQQNHLGPVMTDDPKKEDLVWYLTVAEKREFLIGDTRKDGGGALVEGEKMTKDSACPGTVAFLYSSTLGNLYAYIAD